MFNYTRLDEAQLRFMKVTKIENLPVGERLFLEIGNLSIVIFNLAGRYYAIADVCSHDDGPVGDGDIEGDQVICPRHGARFDLRSGKAMQLPAVVDIAAYPVRVIDDSIEVGIPIK